MKHRFCIIITLFIYAASLLAQDFKAYHSVVPESYDFWFRDPEKVHDPKAHFPLLIFLHGASLCGRNLEKVKKYGPISAVARGANIDSYILAPQTQGAWNPQKIMRIVDWAIQHYAVDTTRIYVYGMSLGGYGTIDLAATYPDRIAAAMAMCGGGSVKDLTGLSKVPLWIIHGTGDRAVSVKESDRVVNIIKATGDDSRLIYTRIPGMDHGRPSRLFYMLMTYDWLFSHSIKDKDRPVNRTFQLTNSMMDNAYKDIGKEAEYDESVYE